MTRNGTIAFFAVIALVALMVLMFLPEPNGSTDGRVHTCGYRTEQGVTEHLDAYQDRCHELR